MSTKSSTVTNIFDPAYDEQESALHDATALETNEALLNEISTLYNFQNDTERNLMNEYARHEDLEDAAGSPLEWVRVAVAQNPKLSQSLLSVLARDEEFVVLLQVLRNPNTPLEALEYLSTYKHADPRENERRHNISRLALSRMGLDAALSARLTM